jgi:murein DD-endopeptidase MepM/ murein hydrolase activator NlpD
MKADKFSEFINSISAKLLYVLDAKLSYDKYTAIDLSETNQTLNAVDVSSSAQLGIYINNHLNKHKALVAYGGYLEIRNIYKRSHHFHGQAEKERNIHLGMDLWCKAGTPIYAPLDGIVHSFNNNINYGDYGPTIILKHIISGVEFYTLYGHLSLDSIKNLKVGKVFKQGDNIGTLGDASVNGDYPPHLHFQIIKDIQSYKGDYPGVCSKQDITFYRTNCPDPNLLLKL